MRVMGTPSSVLSWSEPVRARRRVLLWAENRFPAEAAPRQAVRERLRHAPKHSAVAAIAAKMPAFALA